MHEWQETPVSCHRSYISLPTESGKPADEDTARTTVLRFHPSAINQDSLPDKLLVY